MKPPTPPPMLSLAQAAADNLLTELLTKYSRLHSLTLIDRPVDPSNPYDRAFTQLTITLLQAILDCQNAIAAHQGVTHNGNK